MTKYIPKCKYNKKKHDHKTNRCKPKPPKVRRVRDIIGNIRKKLAALEAANVPSIVIPRQFTYGLVEVNTDIIFREIDKTNKLYIVYAVSSGFQDDVVAYILDDVVVYPDQINSSGEIDHSVFAPGGVSKARLIFRAGGGSQKAVPLLVENTSVDSSFIGTGVSYVVGRFIYDEEIFKAGDPTLRVVLRGKVCRDPRKVTNQWTINPYVHLYDMLTVDRIYGGMGLSVTADLDLPSWIDACNFAEEVLDTPNISYDVIGTDSSFDVLSFEYPINPLQYGDIVTVSGNLPSTLNAGQEYHVIMMKHVVNDISITKVRLALTFDDAMNNIYIHTGLNTKDFKINKVKEIRFASAGSYRGRLDVSVLDDWLQSCASHFTFRDGKLAIVTPKFPTTEKVLTAADLIDTLSMSTKLDFDDRTTSMTGNFIGSTNLFREDDYPTVGGTQFETIDRGEFPRRFDLIKANKATVAARVAQIEFAKRRQEVEIFFPTDIEHYDLNAGSIIKFDFPESQIKSNETFQITSRNLVLQIENDAPVFSLDFTARELDNNTYDFGLTNQQIVEIGRFPSVVNSRNVLPPGTPNVDEELFSTVDGSGLRIKATISWASSGDLFLQGYLLGYKRTEEDLYTYLPISPDTSRIIYDLAPDTYDFQVQTVNTLNFKSAKSTSFNVKILGPYAIPSDVFGFRGQPAGSSILFTWTQVPDLDVRVGGFYEIWWHVDPNGGQEDFALKLTEVSGNLSTKTLSFLRGSYYIRAVDQIGLKGDFAEYSTERVAPVQFAQYVTGDGQFDPTDLVFDEATYQEEPFWASTNVNNTAVVVGSVIRLPTTGSIDAAATPTGWVDIPQFDAVGQIASDGVYYFATGITFDRVIKFRCEAIIQYNLLDLFVTSFDSRPGNVDDFLSWDTVASPGSAEAWIECRVTRDDPSIEDSWSEWTRLYTQDFYHRAIEFRIVLKSYDFQANVEVTRARIYVRELFEPGATASSSPFQVTTPRTGTTPKEAAYSPSVVRVGYYIPTSITQALLLRLQQETTISALHAAFRLSIYQTSSSPWTGSGAGTVLGVNFATAISEQEELFDIGMHAQHVYFFLSPVPVTADAYTTASPATDATNILHRIRAHYRAFVDAWGPNQSLGKGDVCSYNDIYIVDEAFDPQEPSNAYRHSEGPFFSSLGADWPMEALFEARAYFPRTAKLGWNQANLVSGFSPTPEGDSVSGAVSSGNAGYVLFGFTNRIVDATCRYVVIDAILDAMDLGSDYTPDFISVNASIFGTSGATPVLRARYLDLQGIRDFVTEITNLGIGLKLGRLRLSWSVSDGGSVNTITDNDALNIKNIIINWCNFSNCDRILFLTPSAGDPFISLYDNTTGVPITAAGTNTVNFYQNALDGINQILPITERDIPRVWSHDFTSSDHIGLRPVILESGTIASGSYNSRAGFNSTNEDTLIYVDLNDVAKFGIDFGNAFTGVIEVFVHGNANQTPSSPLNQGEFGEPYVYFSKGAGGTSRTKRIVISRGAMGAISGTGLDEKVYFDAWNGTAATSVFTGGPIEVSDLHMQSLLVAAATSPVFPDTFDTPNDVIGGNVGTQTVDNVGFTAALRRSTRIAFSIDMQRALIKVSVHGQPVKSAFAADTLPQIDRCYIAAVPAVDANTTGTYPRWVLNVNRNRNRVRRIKFFDGVKSNSWLEKVSSDPWGTLEAE